MAYLGWDASYEKLPYQQTTSAVLPIANIVTLALNDTMITADATKNPFCYPKLTNGADSPTVMTTSSVATNLVTAAAEFAWSSSPRDLYSLLVASDGPIVKCLRQIPYAAGRTIYWNIRRYPGSNRYVLEMDY